MPYGISAYGQSPQIGSPLQHTGAMIPHMSAGTTTIYAGSESNGSPAAAVSSTALQTTSQSTSSLFRGGEEKRLTREAMERYLRDRNDMIIVVLHAKVITICFVQATADWWKSLLVCISTSKQSWFLGKTIVEILKHFTPSAVRCWFFNFHSFNYRRAGIIFRAMCSSEESNKTASKFPHLQTFKRKTFQLIMFCEFSQWIFQSRLPFVISFMQRHLENKTSASPPLAPRAAVARLIS